MDMRDLRILDKARVGIPKNERILPVVLDILQRGGVEVKRLEKTFFFSNDDLLFVFARVGELLDFFGDDYLDGVFCTRDAWQEYAESSKSKGYILDPDIYGVQRIWPHLCRCMIALIGMPDGMPDGKREFERGAMIIATEYPALTRAFIRKNSDQFPSMPEVWHVMGDAELNVLLQRADFAVTAVETGKTLRNNGLVQFRTILESSLLFVSNLSHDHLRRELLRRFVHYLP